MAQWVKQMFTTLAIPYGHRTVLLSTQLLANALGEATKDFLHTWTPITQEADRDGVPGPCLWSGLVLVVVSLWEVNQRKDNLSLSLSPSLYPSNK